jgi:hypothetical protein
MADYGEWTRKGAVLSDLTAKKQYGVSQDFIVRGIKSGKLEFREGSVWGNPYLRVLRSQLEAYIATQLGTQYLQDKKGQTELRDVNKKIVELKRMLVALEARRSTLTRLAPDKATTKRPTKGHDT